MFHRYLDADELKVTRSIHGLVLFADEMLQLPDKWLRAGLDFAKSFPFIATRIKPRHYSD